jgi:Capsule polysaccharide biosynthesis protein
MTIRRVALIGYPAEYFLPFASALEDAGFEVFWVCALKADAKYLISHGIPVARILDVNYSFRPGSHPLAQCREELAQWENEIDPKVNDIILMDRLISKKDWHFSIEYLHHVGTSISAFLMSNRVSLVTSWRDTAIQLIAMLVARKQGIPFVIPTRLRIPQEVYGFCTAHHTESFLSIRESTEDDAAWSENVLAAFEALTLKPAFKKSARSFTDVLRLLPIHARAFGYEFRRSFDDVANDYTRYTIGKLITMYFNRKVNLLSYKLFNPSVRGVPSDERFCLYALHTQPESSIDVQGSYFSDQLELIRHIARSLPCTHALYVKVHPTDLDGKSLDFYRRVKAIPSVVLVDYNVDSRSLLNRTSLVFALTGTIAYEAGLMRKPVIVFARNFFNALPTVYRCDAPAELPQLIVDVLAKDKHADATRVQVIEFLSRLRASSFDGEVSRTYGASNEPLRPADLRQVQLAYGLVHRAFVDAP